MLQQGSREQPSADVSMMHQDWITSVRCHKGFSEEVSWDSVQDERVRHTTALVVLVGSTLEMIAQAVHCQARGASASRLQVQTEASKSFSAAVQ